MAGSVTTFTRIPSPLARGLLAGSSIPGSRRLVFSAWSPQWEGFYVSSIGGAAYTFHNVGVNYVALRGRAPQPSVLLLNHKAGRSRSGWKPVNHETLWSGYANPQGERLIGFYALQQALFDRYAAEYPAGKVRIFCVGPASAVTNEGAIGSSPLRKGEFTAVVDWAGRGGLGSRLAAISQPGGLRLRRRVGRPRPARLGGD